MMTQALSHWRRCGLVIALTMLVGLVSFEVAAQQFSVPVTLDTNAAADSGDDTAAQVATDQAGNWIAVWQSRDELGGTLGTDSDIFVSRSTDAGVTWSAPGALNTNAASDSGDDEAPQVDHDGFSWVAVWTSSDDLAGSIGSDLDILVSRSTNGGISWSAPVALNTNAASDDGSDVAPQIESDGAGALVAVWYADSMRDTLGLDLNVLTSRSSDGGATWSVAAALNSMAGAVGLTGSDLSPQITSDGAGVWIAVWWSNNTNFGEIGPDFDILFARSTDDGATWSDQAALNSNASTDQLGDANPQLSTDGQGNWVAVWEAYAGEQEFVPPFAAPPAFDIFPAAYLILSASSTDGGITWSTPVRVGRHTVSRGFERDTHPQITTDRAGTWIAMWESTHEDIYPCPCTSQGDDRDIRFSVSTDAGSSWSNGGPLLETTLQFGGPDDSRPQLTTDQSGNWVAIWDSVPNEIPGDKDILISRTTISILDTDGDGLTDSAETNVYGTNPAIPDTDGDGFNDGLEVAAGTDPLNALSRPVAFPAPVALNTTAALDIGTDHSPQITSDGVGTLIAVWTSTDTLSGSIGSDSDILFARSLDDGATWSDPAALATDAGSTITDDFDPQIAADGTGGWVAVWTSGANLGPTEVLVARSLDDGATWSAPAPVDAVFPTAAVADVQPQIASDQAGTWLAVWSSGSLIGDGEILRARSTDGGATWSIAEKIDPLIVQPSRNPALKYDGTGTWLAAWQTTDTLAGTIGSDLDLLVARSVDAGVSWSSAAPLNADAVTDSREDNKVRIASDGNSNWVAVWKSAPTGADTFLLSAGSSDNGLSWSAPIPLNQNPSGSSFELQADIATDGAGTWAVVWKFIGGPLDLAITYSVDNGARWSIPVALVSDFAAVKPRLTTDRRGSWVAAWSSSNSLSGTIGTDSDILFSTGFGPDRDGDGLADAAELNMHGSNPLSPDSDGDGQTDGDEVASGSDPANPRSVPLVLGPPLALGTNASGDSGDDLRAQVTTDGAGVWLAVWDSADDLGATIGTDSDILVARSTNAGATWSAPQPLNSNAATDVNGDSYPQLTTDGAGTWLAVWNSFDTLGGSIGSDADILLARSTDAGLTWSSPQPLNSNAVTDSGSDFLPQLTTDGAGAWLAVWYSLDTLGGTVGSDRDILVARSTDAGVTWSAPQPLNSNAATDAGNDYRPQVTTDGTGAWVAVWFSDDTLGGTIGSDFDVLVARSTDLGGSWSAPAPLNANAASDLGSDSGVQVTTDGMGAWLAVWHSNDNSDPTLGADYDLFLARSTDAGANWSALPPLNSNATTGSGDDFDAQLTTDGVGAWVAIWTTGDDLGGTIGNDADILLARSADNGLTWSQAAPLHPNADSDVGADVTAQITTDAQGNWVAAWSSNDVLGGAIGTDYDVLFSTGFGPDDDGDGVPNAAEVNVHGTDPLDADTDGDGSIDGDEIAGGSDPSDPLSTPLAFRPPLALHTNAPNDSDTDTGAQVATDGLGNWVAVWASNDNYVGLPEVDILVSRSDDDGDTWSAPETLNSNSATSAFGIDERPQITTDGAGNWLAVWQSDRAEAQNFIFDILFARSTDAGLTWTAAARISIADGIDETMPDITTDRAGTWLAVWSQADFEGSDLWISRSFDNAGTWSQPERLEPQFSHIDVGDDLRAQVATDESGNWVIVWDSTDTLLGAALGSDADILISNSTDTLTWTFPQTVNHEAASDSSNDLSPQITVDAAGNWVVVWESGDSVDAISGADFDIMIAQTPNPMFTWPDSTLLNTNGLGDSGDDRSPHLTIDAAGIWRAVWSSTNSLGGTVGDDADIMGATSTDQGVTWSRPLPLVENASTDSGADLFPKLVTDGMGAWVLVWESTDALGETIGIDSDILFMAGDGADRDGDGLSDGAEINIYNTDPLDLDSDDDGFNDGDEVNAGSNPDDAMAILTRFAPPQRLNTATFDLAVDASPQVTTDGAGTWLSVWYSYDTLGGTIGSDADIFVARSTNAGATWSAPQPLNSNAVTDAGADVYPQLTTDGAGTWLAVWDSSDTLGGTIGSDADILVARSTDAGVTWSAPQPLNSNAATDAGADYSPQVTSDGTGAWVAVWLSYDTLGGTIGSDGDVLVARSIDAGATWSAPQPLNSNAATDAGFDTNPQVTTDATGTWVAVWASNDALNATIDADYDILVARSTDAGVSWSAPEMLNSNAATDTGTDFEPQVTTDRAGAWLAVWTSSDSLGETIGGDNDTLVARSADGGVSWSTPAPLTPYAGQDVGTDFHPQVTTDRFGTWEAVWVSGETLGGIVDADRDILAARSLDNGFTWSAPEVRSDNSLGELWEDRAPQIATDHAGLWVTVWQHTEYIAGFNDTDIFFSTGFGPDRDGDSLADVVELNLHGTDPLDKDSDDDGFSDADEVAAGADANNPQSTLLAFLPADLLDPMVAGLAVHGAPQVASTQSDSWLAVWESTDDLAASVGNDFDVLISHSTDGTNWTPSVALNTNAASDTGDDRAPQMTGDGAGLWISVWESTDELGGTIGTDTDIVYVRSTDDGQTWSIPAPLSANAAIDSETDISPQITTDGAGTWLAVWSSADTLGGTLGADTDILIAQSLNGGLNWSVPVALNSNATTDVGDDSWPQITTDAAGTWVAVWTSEDSLGGTIIGHNILFARSFDNGSTWTAPAALYYTGTGAGLDSHPQLETDGTGTWVTVWSSTELASTLGTDRDILFSRSSDNGASWTVPSPIDFSDASGDPGSSIDPQITTDGPGNLTVVWASPDSFNYDIRIAKSYDGAATWSAAADLNSASDPANDFEPHIATDDAGNWVALWARPGTGILFASGFGPDRDGDGLTDGAEYNVHGTNALDPDSDDDGLSDGDEINVQGTDPLDADSDDDGLIDGAETNTGVFVSATDTGTSPLLSDSDGDGLSDIAEIVSTVFVTSTVTNGAFGGLAVADAQCDVLASNAGLGTGFTSWISDSTIDARDRITNATYQRVDGVVVASGIADLTANSLSAAIDRTELGAVVNVAVATGTQSDGTKAPGLMCDDWTSDLGSALGGASILTVGWTDGNMASCAAPAASYCFGPPVMKSDPNALDSDNDGLSDAVETGTGSFLGAGDTGTDPLSDDTDGDGFADGREIGFGTSPTDLGDAPQAGALLTTQMALVSDEGNAADPDTGLGAVGSVYTIALYEVTNQHYAIFLNAVAEDDPNALYNPSMETGPNGGIARLGLPGSYIYLPVPGRETWPVVYVSQSDARRYVNWLENDQPIGPQGLLTTEDGTYSGFGETDLRNPGVDWSLPNLDEWYKAAYLDLGNPTEYYFDYPVGSDLVTTCASPTATIDTANCNNVVGELESVGGYSGALSPSGVFDLGGNAAEWTESSPGVGQFVVVGGDYTSPVSVLDRMDAGLDVALTDEESARLGFRVVPEPGVGLTLLFGAGMLGVLGSRRRRARSAAALHS